MSNNAPASKREKEYKKIASVWEKKDYPGQFSVSVDSYYGDLVFKQIIKSDDGNYFMERFWKVKYISLFAPKAFNGKEPHPNLRFNLTLDLKNEREVEFLGETEWQPIITSDGGEGQGQGEQE